MRTGFNFRISFTASQYLCPLCIVVLLTTRNRFKTGDVKLNVWLEHIIDGERKKISAFDSIVMVVEPELSIFDFKLYVTSLRHVRGMIEAIFPA